MPAIKGLEREFEIGVVGAFLLKQQGIKSDGEPVNAGDAASVNEHLFPKSGRCLGLLVNSIDLNLSRPEIIRQLPQLEGVDLENSSLDQIKGILGDHVTLVSTGK